MQLAAIINAHSTPRASQKPTGNVKDDPDHRLATFAAMNGFRQLDNDISVSPGVSSDDGEYSFVQPRYSPDSPVLFRISHRDP